MRLDILGVQAFVAVAEFGKFNAAANYLFLSETALSRRVKNLEDSLGVALFARTTRATTLTSGGVEFLPKARRIVNDLTNALEELRTGSAKPARTVRIGCLPTLAALSLAPILLRLSASRQKVQVLVVERPMTEIREALMRGELDFCITLASPAHPHLEYESAFSDELVVACHRTHPFAQRSTLGWDDLSDATMIAMGGMTDHRRMVDAFIEENGLQLTWTYEVERFSTALDLVAAGVGVTLVPATAVSPQQYGAISIVRLRDQVIRREIALMKKSAPLSPAAQELYQMARESLAKPALRPHR